MSGHSVRQDRRHEIVTDTGTPRTMVAWNEPTIAATLRLDDGRQVHVTLSEDGRITLQAHGADPTLTHHTPAVVSLSLTLPTLTEMVLEGASPHNVSLTQRTHQAQHLVGPGSPDDAYEWMTTPNRKQLDSLRTMVALQSQDG